jgi:hypothetical protein
VSALAKEEDVPDQTNIELLLSKLPAESLARRLVAPFADQPLDGAIKAAQDVLAAVKAAHQDELRRDAPEEA